MGESERAGDALASINPEILEGVIAILSKLTGLQPGVIQPYQCLGTDQTPCDGDPMGQAAPLGLDSLDLINVTMEVEERFGITISDDEQAYQTNGRVSGLALFVQGKVMAKLLATDTAPTPDPTAPGHFLATAPIADHDAAVSILSTAIGELGWRIPGFTPVSMAGAMKRQLTVHHAGIARLSPGQAEAELALEAGFDQLPEG